MDLFHRKRKKQLEKEKLEAEKRLKEQERLQEQLFNEFLTAVDRAVQEVNRSKNFKMYDGKIAEEVGDMKYFVANKRTSICVFVEHLEMLKYLQPVVCQVDIKVPEDRIHILFGAYGPSRNYDIGRNARTARNVVVAHIKEWRLHK